MKKMTHLMTCAVVAAMSMEVAKAALNIPSDGSDGDLVVTNNLEIDLSRAISGNWTNNNTANAGKGIYDSEKWAVVFKYSSVTIQGGATVTFKNHASRAPVVWLVQGDVTINGTVSLNGQAGLLGPWLAEPGPGGFRGGSAYYAAGASTSAAFGPGGGAVQWNYNGAGGSYGGAGYYHNGLTPTNPPYGNQSLLPLVGGSGGSSYTDNNKRMSGGAGGGAMLIACANKLTLASATASIRANGGAGGDGNACGGSGGGIRLVAETFAGNGTIEALGGARAPNDQLFGGVGRIRLERATNTFSGITAPTSPSLVTLAAGATPVIWLPNNGPTVRIVSIGGITPPADPRAEFGSVGADVVVPQVTNVTVVIETTYVEWPTATNQVASVITARATPRSDGNFTVAQAVLTQVISEDPPVARWTANVPVQNGYAAIQVKVVRP